MRILYLLFPFFLLLLQGAAGSYNSCRRRGGFCTFGHCRFSDRIIASCPRFHQCCRR
uniref:Beta-defensin-like domain-containing protein n=1 Tax=Dromaius novaehollandiae TaxID=8790 RepID=A0A8C4K6I0_DRONO